MKRALKLMTVAGLQMPATDVVAAKATPSVLALAQSLCTDNCALCHATNSEGQPDWRRRLPIGQMLAPPHDDSGHTWHHSDASLFQLAKQGVAAVVGYESDMSAFDGLLNDEEIHAVLEYIKSTWSERQREYQATIAHQSKEASK